MSMRDAAPNFYANLPAFPRFADVTDLARYRAAPDSWRVVITDVKGSTRAIEQGRYKEVNALGTGSIVATLNAVGDVDIPFVFGGDGATLLIPATVEAKVRGALAGVAKLAQDCFELELRVGVVPVQAVRARGAEVLVARYEASKDVTLAMLSGGGAEVAEELVKDEAAGADFRVAPAQDDPAEYTSLLEGFHCRWNPIASRNGKTLCVLVVALGDDAAARHQTYARVLGRFDEAGGIRALNPVSRQSLDLAVDASSMDVEARLRTGRTKGLKHRAYATKTAMSTRVGRHLMRTERRLGDFDGKTYPQEVVANADFHKFDDALRLVLDVSAEQLELIEDGLSQERARGSIAYGLHASDGALMTCMVFDFRGRHVHFVDGSDGGYAMAAKQLKAQLRGEAS